MRFGGTASLAEVHDLCYERWRFTSFSSQSPEYCPVAQFLVKTLPNQGNRLACSWPRRSLLQMQRSSLFTVSCDCLEGAYFGKIGLVPR